MSYILDALKKSESERQLQNAPGIADVPVQSRRGRVPGWIWVLGGLLLINALVLGGLLLRNVDKVPATVIVAPVDQPEIGVAPVVQDVEATAAADTAAITRLDAAAVPYVARPKSLTPVPADSAPANIAPSPASPAPEPQPAAPPVSTSQPAAGSRASSQPAARQPAASSAPLPTLMELQASGRLQLPELHLDVHVYSGSPPDRFVFINMSKYREQSRLTEGPLLTEIREDGVVLEYQGRTFLLPRE